MACSNVSKPVFVDSKPVFVDTNLGTGIAVPVSPDITAKEFKRELEMVHVNFFPEVGNITVKGLMVKKRSCYYHLSESLPLKYCFCGSNATWFLHAIIIATQINSSETDSLQCKSVNDVTPPVNHNSSSPCKKVSCKRKKSKIQKSLSFRALVLKLFGLVYLLRRKRKRTKKCKSESPRKLVTRAEVNWSQERDENLSESVCVSGIIKKYFSDYEEVASSPRSNRKILNNRSGFASPLMHPGSRVSRSLRNNKPTSEALGLKCKKPEVGRRLLQASENLGLSPSYKGSVISFCKFNNRKSPVYKSSITLRSLVFEMPDESD